MRLHSTALLLTYLLPLFAAAQDAHERSDLGLAQQQIIAIEQLADRARGSADDTEARYRFNYPRLIADLVRMRQGINKYLSPSRAQPADLSELAGDYRAEAPLTSKSDEHD